MKNYSVVLFIIFSGLVQASEYPADYAIKSSCQTQGPVRVCRSLQVGNRFAVLDLSYEGALLPSSGISVWAQVNYSDGPRQNLFPMSVYSLPDAKPFAVRRITGGCLASTDDGCVETGSPEMADLLIWAQQADGTLNALSLDLAFVNKENKWDNNDKPKGTYHFDFPQN